MFQKMSDYWHNLVNSGDSRSNELLFIRDPTVVVCAAIAYLVMVTVGPSLMKKRDPLQLRKILIGYNFCSVLFSVWMMWEFFACSFLNKDFNLFCQETDEKDNSPMTLKLIRAHWWYFFSKFIEFLDTFFFVVRKKNNQISFLHVYHHVSMLMFQWCLVKYVPGSVSYFGPLLNCFIHALMYSYYMLSAFGPHMQKYLWWKKYLTKMQMYQFVLIFFYCSNLMTHDMNEVGRFFAWFNWFYMISLFWLFNHFYQTSYVEKKKLDSNDMQLFEKCKGE